MGSLWDGPNGAIQLLPSACELAAAQATWVMNFDGRATTASEQVEGNWVVLTELSSGMYSVITIFAMSLSEIFHCLSRSAIAENFRG